MDIPEKRDFRMDRIATLTDIFMQSNNEISLRLADIEQLVLEIVKEGCREEKERTLGILNIVNTLIDRRNGIITVSNRLRLGIPDSREDDANEQMLNKEITQIFLTIINKFTHK